MLSKIRGELKLGKALSFVVYDDDVSRFKSQLCVLDVNDLRKIVMIEAHYTAYTIHPAANKMYKDLSDRY